MVIPCWNYHTREKMKIAYLIAAYTDPKQLHRLVEALYNDRNEFYIHIDKKSDITPFFEILGDRECVHFIKRIKDFWGGYSHLHVLDLLLENTVYKDYDRLVYISGLDYPIWSNDKMEQFYQENPRKQLLCGYNVTKSKVPLARTKIDRYACWDVYIKNEKLFNKTRKILNNILGHIPHPASFFVKGQEWDVFWGSDWWSLTADCAKYIYETYHQNPEIKKFFKYTFSPNELWVQTIAANSKYREEMDFTVNYSFNEVTVLEYLEYKDKIRVWKEEDFDDILKSGKMFIRKVTSESSGGLCNKIDKHRNHIV